MNDDTRARNHRTVAVLGALGTVAAIGAVLLLRPGTWAPDTPTETASAPLTATMIHKDLDYPLAEVAANKIAPRVFLSSLNVELDRIPEVADKKATFFRILLPMIARENDRVRAERQKIVDNPTAVSDSLYSRYGVPSGDVDMLLRRVDIVPASLALAQAALESGWGTSRFATEGNNFFGMRTYDPDARGMEPLQAEGFKVMVFKDIGHGVRAYIRNLNTHSAYRDFRTARARMRAEGDNPSGRYLSSYLAAYSEIPGKYGRRLRNLIDVNRLTRFDGVRLAAD